MLSLQKNYCIVNYFCKESIFYLGGKTLNTNHEMVLVIDFGGQYNQLIARRVRECGVYCEIVPYDYTIEKIKAKNPQAIIFTGGPSSVYADNTPQADPKIFELGIPVLGICYGHQFMAHNLGGKVAHAELVNMVNEY